MALMRAEGSVLRVVLCPSTTSSFQLDVSLPLKGPALSTARPLHAVSRLSSTSSLSSRSLRLRPTTTAVRRPCRSSGSGKDQLDELEGLAFEDGVEREEQCLGEDSEQGGLSGSKVRRISS